MEISECIKQVTYFGRGREMGFLIVLLLTIIVILLFEINGKLPKRDRNKDEVRRALKRDQERRNREKERDD